MKLPHCDPLFLRFFGRWYDDDARKRRPFKATMPDILQDGSFVGRTQSDVSPIVEEGQKQALKQISVMIDAARGDLPTYLPVRGEISLAWVKAFDEYYDRKRIADVIKRSEETDFANDYLVTCCEFGAVLSHVLQKMEPRFIWRLDWPYWDSCLLDPKSGSAVAVFHWAIKKMSEYGVDDGFAAKVKACLDAINEERRIGA